LQKQIWNISKLLAWAIDYFKTKEIPEPRLSAELLLSAVLNLSRMDLYLKYDLELDESQLKKYKEMIIRRLDHEPIQYITGEAYFRKIKLEVDKSVLIPRPETELVVESAKKAILRLAGPKTTSVKSAEADAIKSGSTENIEKTSLSPNQVINVLEIGIGSGAIALSLLFESEINEDQTLPISVIATDISGEALKTAFKNAGNILTPQKLGHLELFECDVVPGDSEKFINKYLKNMDIIISNPPYIAEDNYKNLEKQVKDYEPEQALNAGKTGTEQYSHIIKRVKPFLNPAAACIIFETDPLTSPELQRIIRSEFKDCSIAVEKDYNGLDRILTAFIGN